MPFRVSPSGPMKELSPEGIAGGDLSGNYPTPAVSRASFINGSLPFGNANEGDSLVISGGKVTGLAQPMEPLWGSIFGGIHSANRGVLTINPNILLCYVFQVEKTIRIQRIRVFSYVKLTTEAVRSFSVQFYQGGWDYSGYHTKIAGATATVNVPKDRAIIEMQLSQSALFVPGIYSVGFLTGAVFGSSLFGVDGTGDFYGAWPLSYMRSPVVTMPESVLYGPSSGESGNTVARVYWEYQ